MPKLLVYTGNGDDLYLRDKKLVPLRVKDGLSVDVAVDLQVLYKRCGKADCRGCPHGPYAYLAIRYPRGRKVMKHIGTLPDGSPLVPKELPASSRRSAAAPRRGPRGALRRKNGGMFPRDTDSCSCGD